MYIITQTLHWSYKIISNKNPGNAEVKALGWSVIMDEKPGILL